MSEESELNKEMKLGRETKKVSKKLFEDLYLNNRFIDILELFTINPIDVNKIYEVTTGIEGQDYFDDDEWDWNITCSQSISPIELYKKLEELTENWENKRFHKLIDSKLEIMKNFIKGKNIEQETIDKKLNVEIDDLKKKSHENGKDVHSELGTDKKETNDKINTDPTLQESNVREEQKTCIIISPDQIPCREPIYEILSQGADSSKKSKINKVKKIKKSKSKKDKKQKKIKINKEERKKIEGMLVLLLKKFLSLKIIKNIMKY